MPNYTLAQLRAMQADRRYWDARDPANAAFVAQVDQGYRDLFDEPAALMPTPEQEEQSRRLEEDLRRRMAQSEYWNPRHADYQRLHDDVAEGYARLYPMAVSSATEPESPSPPEPVNLLELTQQMAQAQPRPSPLVLAQNAMTATQDDDPPPPPPPEPKPTPENRPVPEITNPVPGAPIRGQDPAGAGHFGAGRGTRTHSGVDIVAPPGTPIVAPVSGTVRKIDVEPYTDPKHKGRYTGIDIETDDGHFVRIFYVTPAKGLEAGARIEKGETQIGQAQDLHQSHDKRMTNHIHMEVHRPADSPAGKGRPSRNYVDPSSFVRDR